MASTRNLNEKAEYSCEKKMNKNYADYMTASYYGETPGNTIMFDLGTGPSKMYGGNMSHNSVDIESKLRGIRSTNLEGPNFNPALQTKSTQSQELFDNHLRNNVYLPNPVIHYVNERGGFHNL